MKPIAHFEHRYKISADGTVINLANNTPLTPIKHKNGYLVVSLSTGKAGKNKIMLIHRLVALHFLPNPYGHNQINHIDGDKTNNVLENLEWCYSAQNHLHALKTGLRPGYMSADDKEKYLQEVLSGTRVVDLASRIGRRPETLSKMLRETAKRLGIQEQWKKTMRESRRDAAIRNLAKTNT